MRLKKMSDYILRLVEAPPGERSERDINAILPVLTMKTSCFRSIDRDTVAYVLQKARLEKYMTDDVITRQGDIGDVFYIILKGSVSIYLDVKKDEKTVISEDNPTFPLPAPRRLSFMTDTDKDGGSDKQSDIHSASGSRRDYSSRSRREQSSRSIREFVQFSQLPSRPQSKTFRIDHKRKYSLKRDHSKDDKRGRKKLGVCVNSLSQFQSFGELALIYPNRQRNASAIADEPTDLLTISYELFENTLQDSLEQDLDEKRLFIQTHPFFSKWNPQMQRQLQWSLTRSEYRIGDHVIKQGDQIMGLSFLVTGRARVAGEPVRHRILFPDLFIKPKKSVFEKDEPETIQREDTSVAELADSIRLSKTRRHILAGMDPLTYIRRTDGYAAAEKVMNEKLVDLCNVEEGEVIGDVELLLGLERNIFTLIATSTCTVFQLEAKIFDRLVYKKSPHTLSMMKFLAEQKLSRRLSSSQGHKMPILSPLLFQILDVRVVDPADEKNDKAHIVSTKAENLPKVNVPSKLQRSKTVLINWFIHGKTPLLQPINKDAILYRDIIQKRAKFRETTRERGPKEQREVKSLGRRIKDSYWFNMKEKRKAVNTMKRLKLQNSELTQASRWK